MLPHPLSSQLAFFVDPPTWGLGSETKVTFSEPTRSCLWMTSPLKAHRRVGIPKRASVEEDICIERQSLVSRILGNGEKYKTSEEQITYI